MQAKKTSTKHQDQLPEIIRQKCYHCYRPMSSCMCEEVRPLTNRTKFIILMHPKEYRKIKNGTGHLTKLSLKDAELYVGIDFSEHKQINALVDDPNNRCFILYPSHNSVELNHHKVVDNDENLVLFLIDSTWACANKMMRLSANLRNLPHLSFTHTKTSAFAIKEQPREYCLSTIESTQTVLEILTDQGYESLTQEALEAFLNPFKAMVSYQLKQLDMHKEEKTSRYRKRD